MGRRNIKEIKETLMHALILLLKDHTLQDINVKMLCNSAQMHRSTFYAHYEGLSQLLDEMESEYLEHVVFIDCHAGKAELMDAVLQYAHYARSHSELFLALIKCNRLMQPFSLQARETTHAVNHKKELPFAEAREGLVSAYTVSGVMRLTEEWISRYPQYPDEAVAEIIVCLARSSAAVLDRL